MWEYKEKAYPQANNAKTQHFQGKNRQTGHFGSFSPGNSTKGNKKRRSQKWWENK